MIPAPRGETNGLVDATTGLRLAATGIIAIGWRHRWRCPDILGRATVVARPAVLRIIASPGALFSIPFSWRERVLGPRVANLSSALPTVLVHRPLRRWPRLHPVRPCPL